MSTRFFTNEDGNTLLRKFAGVFEHNPDIAWFDALVGFFRASGYFALRPYLENVPHIRVLVGIDVDEMVRKYHKEGLLFQGNPAETVGSFTARLKADIQRSRYERRVEEGILQFVADIASGKLELKAHPSKRLHAKIYIFRPETWNEHKGGHVITGSSNLTDAGLGTVNEAGNYEFNVLLNDYDDVAFATREFEALWEEAVPILSSAVKDARDHTYLNDAYTPFEIYMKFLIEYFGPAVDFDPKSMSDLPQGYLRLNYQEDAVEQGGRLLHKHGGFFLADVVGLGKTVIATRIAKRFFHTNGYPGHISRTLVIVPPALRKDWERAMEEFQVPNYRIVSNGSLHKVKYPDSYDLVIVDEAHKFRNDTAGAYTDLQVLCKTPSRRQLPDGSRQAKRVILVSATPLNNRPEDIRNLVYLFQSGKETTLPVGNLGAFFAKRIEEYRKARRMDDLDEVRRAVAGIYETIREQVIAPLTVRRTRTDLADNEMYNKDLLAQGIWFPDVEQPPRKVLYQLDPGLEDLYDRTMHLLTDPESGLTYNRYRAIQFLVPAKKAKYENADMLSSQLAKIMKVLLLKRLDSSFFAFEKSLARFRDATQAMVAMFEQERIYIAPNVDVNEYILNDREDELIEELARRQETDPSIEIVTPEDFREGFLEGLLKDRDILSELTDTWEAVEGDPKRDAFLERLRSELLDPECNPGGKLVVFSESKETSQHLVDELKAAGYSKTLCIHGDNRQHNREAIRANFDANLAAEEQRNEVDILVTTEVLAEGVNLHRANVVVHYDTPWNSTRLTQRLGRVNRIGTTAASIYNTIFYPTSKIDNDIELRKRAIMKLQAFHSALGEDSQIYSEDEEIGTFGLFDRNLEEERDESLAFLDELRRFRRENPGRFRHIRNLPTRARCGRENADLDLTTAVFIRNRRRDGFYHVKQGGGLDELGFVECARLFKAAANEPALPLHDQHHDQIQAAEESFRERVQSDIVAAKSVDASQGPQERQALAFLNACENMPMTSDGERELVRAAKSAIKRAKFQQLTRDVNKIHKNQKKAKVAFAQTLDTLLSALKKYPLSEAGEPGEPATSSALEATAPEIVISESFSARGAARGDTRPLM